MKKTILTMIFAAVISFSYAETASNPVKKQPIENHLTKEEADKKIQRLEEIQKMDLKNLTRKEKRAIRKEVKSIEAELAESNGGVYLSTGAIIIILLILILVL